MGNWGKATAAPAGSSGNNTHGSIEVPSDWEHVCYLFIVEAVGATPTVTYKWQYSNDDVTVSDANSTWYDLDYILPGTAETVVNATRARTAVGSDLVFPLSGQACRFQRKIRLVTSANTNVTYRAEITGQNPSI
jgi:hypothetical protein